MTRKEVQIISNNRPEMMRKMYYQSPVGRLELTADEKVQLSLHGTDFQLRDWQALLRIPYGETRSYGEIARQIGCPRGSRAVGMANRNNPVAIIVPCHRVIGSDGSLTGYMGKNKSLDIKEYLLKLEGAL